MFHLSSCAALGALGQAAGGTAGGVSEVNAGNAGVPASGDAGSPSSGGGGAVAPGGSEAGAAPELAGSANGGKASGIGGSSANAGTAGNIAGSGGTLGGGASGTPAGGTPAGGAGGPSGGTGGAAWAGPCGDLNHDLVDDCTQTLVQNSRFDTSVTGWVAEAALTEAWVNVNASGKPGSGSISLTQTGAPGMDGARQCIPVTPFASYDIAARVQVGAGQTGTAGINVYFYDDDACQGNFVPPPPNTSTTPIEGGVAGSWTELATGVPLWIPRGVGSMYVRLVANKPLFQTTPLTVLIDDVLVAKRVMP